jgi:hypothetical protein
MARTKNPTRPLLAGGIVLLGGGLGLYAGGMGGIGQWLVLAGTIFCFLYLVIRRTAKTPEASRHPESALFSQSTTLESLEAEKRDPRKGE